MDSRTAETYLTGVTDQLGAAVARGDGETAEHIVDQVDADGHQAAAVALGRALDRTSVADSRPDRYMMATTAHHALGDISRDEPSLAIIAREEGDHYIGEWASGIGYINVRFPKATTRELTADEKRTYSNLAIETAGMVRPIRFEDTAS